MRADGFARLGDRMIAAIWLALVTSAVALLAISFMFPLSPLVGAIVILSFCLLSLLSQKTRAELRELWVQRSWILIAVFFTGSIIVSALTAREVTWVDTGLYHYSSIQWLAHYGTVPGLALLLANFGFTSSWFAFAAPLNGDFFDDRFSAVTNGFVFLVAVLHWIISLVHFSTRQAYLSDQFTFLFLSIVLPFTVRSNLLSVILVSPSPDLPVFLLVFVIAWSILVSLPQQMEAHYSTVTQLNTRIIPLVLSVGAVTIKLIALPLLFISFLFSVSTPNLTLRRVGIVSAIVIVLISPMVISAITTSGCPLFPSNLFCLDLPWSPKAKMIKAIATGTHGWTAWFGKPPSGTNTSLWLLQKWLTSEKLNQAIAFMIFISLFCLLDLIRIRRKILIQPLLWMAVVAISGTTFLMSTAPFFRFIFPYVMILPVLWVVIRFEATFIAVESAVIKQIAERNFHRFLSRLLLTSPFFVVTLMFAIGFTNHSLIHLVMPPRLREVEVEQKQANNILYFAPKVSAHLCWATQLPCAFEIRDHVTLRDPNRGVAGGFVRKE
jgi:hypothetical protein